ncbi:MAG: FkbM family methyltransferase [Rhizobiaceae bacterium]
MAGVKAELDLATPIGALRAGFWQKFIWQVCDWRPLPQKWRQKLRKRYARKVVGPFDITHDGMKFRLYPAENYCDRVLFGRDDLPERPEHEALRSVLEPGCVFVDIGANVGTYSIYVSQMLKGDCTILAMEPHPRTYQKLVFNLQANDIATDMALNVGIGPTRGSIDLWSDGGSNVGHTSMVKQGTANPKIRHKVSIVPLVELLAEHDLSKIDVLKIDIEGFEDQALAPFFDTADQSLWPKHILIEIAHQGLWQRDLMAMLDKRGYGEVFRTKENRLLCLKQ